LAPTATNGTPSAQIAATLSAFRTKFAFISSPVQSLRQGMLPLCSIRLHQSLNATSIVGVPQARFARGWAKARKNAFIAQYPVVLAMQSDLSLDIRALISAVSFPILGA
jgi:hypothetical protein